MRDDTARKLLKQGWDDFMEGRFEGARRAAKEILAFFPHEVEALTLLGRAHKEFGALDEALALFERAYRLDPTYHEAALTAAETHLDYTRDFQEAERLATSVLDGLSEDEKNQVPTPDVMSLALVIRADARLSLGKAEEALQDLDTILGEVRFSNDYIQLRARVLYELDQLDEAVSHLEELIEIEPENPENHYALALVHLKREEFDEAVWEFQKVLELEANQPPPDRGLSNEEFENLAERVIEDLPSDIKTFLGEVQVVVQARPTDDLVEDGIDPRAPGIIDGRDMDAASKDRSGSLRLVLFKHNLEAYCRSVSELEREIWNTVMREAEHYMSMAEE